MCATDLGALNGSYHPSGALARFRKSRSYGDFSSVSDVTDSDGAGEESQESRDLPSSKRRAGSTENLLYLETLASRLPLVGSLPAQVTNRVRLPDQEPAQPSSISPLHPCTASALPAGRDCNGSCGCPGERACEMERRFTLSRPRTSPGEPLASCSPFVAAAAAVAAGAAPPPGAPTERCTSVDGAQPCSHAQSSPAPPRLCSLFRSSSSSSLLLVEPPSLIGPSISPSPAASLDGTASPPSTTSCASPFGAYTSTFASASAAGGADTVAGAVRMLHHSRSEDALLDPAAHCGSVDLGPPRPSIDLGPPRASMDGFCVTSPHLSEGSAAEELFYRLNHARQTVDFVKRQAAVYAPLNRAEMDVWEALGMLDTLREYETALLGDDDSDATLSLMDHALQTAEACRLAYPDDDWLHLVGLIHDLGKLLAHKQWGSEPQWAVCGETFPVGCRFHPAIQHSQFFSANPDRRRRVYSSATGMYQPGCGLNSVYMSWSAAEYLYMVLLKNKAALPPEALFVVRYHRCAVLLRPGAPYAELLSEADRRCLPWLRRFRELARYTRRELPGRLEGEGLRNYYSGLLRKYIPQGKLQW